MKRFTAFLIAMIFILIPINTFADESRFDTAHDMYNYFSAHNNFPDYICGMWSTDGTVHSLTISVLNNEEGEKGKQEILDWVRDDESITFVYGKYSLNFLRQIQDEITKILSSENGLIYTAFLDDKNVVEIGVYSEKKDSPETVSVISDITEKYSDAVSIVYTEQCFVYNAFLYENIGPDVIFDTDVTETIPEFRMFAVIVAVFMMGIVLLVVVILRNRKKHLLVSANGELFGVTSKLTDKRVEQMVKNSEVEVPLDLKDRIFKEIENRK